MSEDKTSNTAKASPLRRLRRPRSSVLRFGNVTVERIGVPKAPFGEAFHFLMRSSWPIFCLVFSAYYLLINAIFGAVYYWDLGASRMRGPSPTWMRSCFPCRRSRRSDMAIWPRNPAS
jgi:hypothetical protein